MARVLFKQGSASVVRSLNVDYMGELNYPATVNIDTPIGRLGRSPFGVEQILVDGDRVAAKAVCTYVLADTAAGRSMELPAALRDYFSSLSGNSDSDDSG